MSILAEQEEVGVVLTYLIALGLLFGTGTYRILRLGFPIWVFVVSIFILMVSQKKIDNQESDG